MQFLYQHPEYCQRLILVSSGGLGPDVGWVLRLLAAPGAEFWLPAIAPQPVLAVGNRMRSWLTAAGLGSPRAEQIWAAYSSLSDAPTRAAFLRTLRSVVDYRGQSVSALNRLSLRAEVPTLVIWGEQDPIIPVDHGYGVRAARPGSQLVVLPGLGHFPQVEDPGAVVVAIEEFITDGTPEAAERAANQGQRPRNDLGSSEKSSGRDPERRSVIEHLKSRQQSEVGIGVLMGLRGCSQTEAASEFTTAVHETGIAAGDLGRALADLASGNATFSPDRARARERWGHLLKLRGLGGDPNVAAPGHPVRVRYGPENESVIC